MKSNGRCRPQQSFARLHVGLSLWLLVSATPTLACDDPARHPELDQLTTLLNSLPPQPPGLVAVKYAIESERRVGEPVPVRVSFWPIEPYDRGRFVVRPSPGVTLVGFSGAAEIPYKGSIEFAVLPTQPGFLYLELETLVEKGGEERRRIVVLTLPVDPDQAGTASAARSAVLGNPPAAFGFAGDKILNALAKGRQPHPAESKETNDSLTD